MEFINVVYDEEAESVEGFELVEDMELTPIQQRALDALTGRAK